MFNRAEMKQMAREQIRPNLLMLVVASAVPMIISSVLSLIPMVGPIASMLISPVLSVGLISIYLGLCCGQEVKVESLFDYKDHFWHMFCVSFWTGLRIFLWSLLLWVPGIIASFRYAMVFYIAADNPELSTNEMLELSDRMTMGHKMDLFMLGLSFFGWIMLCGVTFGLAAIWVIPYIQATNANVYFALKKELNDPAIG